PRDKRNHAVCAVARRIDQGIVQSTHTTEPEDAVREFGRQSSKPLVPPQNSLEDCLVHPSFLPRKNQKRLSFQRQFGSLRRTSHLPPVGEMVGLLSLTIGPGCRKANSGRSATMACPEWVARP